MYASAIAERVSPDCCAIVVIIGISYFLSFVSCVTAQEREQEAQFVSDHL
jgi:hypothetical protein